MNINIQEAALAGHLTIVCTLIGGAQVPVTIRLVKISERGVFIDAAMRDEIEALKMVLKDPADFDVDTLTDESFTALVEANTELNFQRAWASVSAKLIRAGRTGMRLAELRSQMDSLSQKYAPQSQSAEVSPGSS